ncbi:FecR family protein [Parapedobacter tibetensis]|uniref:FecR family protein n=1 Tax=Parapedobacter tibetensis TaxID=2972951 RepID=UPI00214DD6A6|nr:FecR family protein [Parapedobacter tibetensis]
MRPENIKSILVRYRNGEATDADKAFLESWYAWYQKQGLPADYPVADRLADAEVVWRRLQHKPNRLRRWLPYAAAIFIAAVAGTWIFLDNRQQTTDNRLAATDIQPGGNRATLTLADGRTIDLSEGHEGIVVGDGITYQDGSKILDVRYETLDRVRPLADMRADSASESYLTSHISHLMSLTTPKGGTYRITLPDGSKVWLNAASTLRYPSRFDGKERVVELEGEAYFEVSHQLSAVSSRLSATGHRPMDENNPRAESRKPTAEKVSFKVKTKNQTIEVLGTQFNITAYADESETKTTLVEGAVRLSVGATGASVSLVPGEQGVLESGKLQVKEVDVEPYTAWRYGKFSFNNKTFAQIMEELARWYDLDIVYENGIPEEELAGDAFRNQNFSLILRILDAVEINYKLDAPSRKLIINGKKQQIR